MKMRCDKWWKSKSHLEDESVFMGFWGSQACLQILKLKGVEGQSAPLAFTTLCLLPLSLSRPKYMLNCKLSIAAMLYNSLWQKLVHGNVYIVFFLSYGKHDLLKVVAWRCSIWIWAPLFHKKGGFTCLYPL